MEDLPQRSIKLTRPIDLADGSKITDLTFREPRGTDIAKAGNPVKIDPFNGDYEFDDAKILAMAALLSGQPVAIIGAVRGEDWVGLTWVVASFFFPSQPKTTP